jgi:hypothetical protein
MPGVEFRKRSEFSHRIYLELTLVMGYRMTEAGVRE